MALIEIDYMKKKSKLEEGYAEHIGWLSDEAGVFNWNSIVESVFKDLPSPRIIKGVRGCVTVGTVDIMSFYNCGNEKCSPCKMYNDALQEEMKNQIKNEKDRYK